MMVKVGCSRKLYVFDDYELGHDDRARAPQPVASVLGPRFYDWQLAQSIDESWEECERHAELLNKIVPPVRPPDAPEEQAAELVGTSIPITLFGEPQNPGLKKRR